jgi:hypothetical protein
MYGRDEPAGPPPAWTELGTTDTGGVATRGEHVTSLLPGLLAATRTGLTPAGDDELMLDQVNSNDHLQRWAHSKDLCR